MLHTGYGDSNDFMEISAMRDGTAWGFTLIKSHLWKACIFYSRSYNDWSIINMRKGNARALGITQGLAQMNLGFFFFSSPGIHVNVSYLEVIGNMQLPPSNPRQILQRKSYPQAFSFQFLVTEVLASALTLPI